LDLDKIFTLKWRKTEGSSDFAFLITLQKSDNYLTFGISDTVLFRDFYDILKKLCILDGFHSHYDVIETLGSGHFASVFLVHHKETSEKFAAKIFQKNNEDFKQNKVVFC